MIECEQLSGLRHTGLHLVSDQENSVLVADLHSRMYSEHQKPEATISLKQVGEARSLNLQILHETHEPGAETGEDMLQHIAAISVMIGTGKEHEIPRVRQALRRVNP